MSTETSHREETVQPAVTLQRRGLFALGWAAVMGFVFRHTTEPLQAAAPLQFGNLASGTPVENDALGPTRIISQLGYVGTGAVFIGQAFGPDAICGLQGVSGSRPAIPMPCGVYGNQDTAVAPSAGILGDDRGAMGAGVLGRSGSAGAGNGVGVQGESRGGIGVRGLIANTSNLNAIAVYGLNNSSFAGPSTGAGGFGVYGLSAHGHGLVGATATAGGAAVVGATNGVAGAYAGAFYGPVVVSGDFTVIGAKSAAVPHPDGSLRRLYCVESPESWFEDFGKARLDDCGRTVVTLDPNFAAVADLSDYHVFLTAYGIDRPLYVVEQSASGFVVSASASAAGGGPERGSFSWRVVAKRKDIEGPRFASVTIPPAPICPDLPAAV